MKHHVWTVFAALVLLGTALGCGSGAKSEAPKRFYEPSKEQKGTGSATPPQHPK